MRAMSSADVMRFACQSVMAFSVAWIVRAGYDAQRFTRRCRPRELIHHGSSAGFAGAIEILGGGFGRGAKPLRVMMTPCPFGSLVSIHAPGTRARPRSSGGVASRRIHLASKPTAA